MRTVNNLKYISLLLIILPLLYCSKSDSGGENSAKLDTITQEQKIILSRLDTIEGNQKTLLKNDTGFSKTLKNIENSLKTISADNKNIAKNNEQNKADKVYDIPIGDSFVLGPKDAKVTIIEWADFQ